jgi:hypothetical protein
MKGVWWLSILQGFYVALKLFLIATVIHSSCTKLGKFEKLYLRKHRTTFHHHLAAQIFLWRMGARTLSEYQDQRWSSRLCTVQ